MWCPAGRSAPLSACALLPVVNHSAAAVGPASSSYVDAEKRRNVAVLSTQVPSTALNSAKVSVPNFVLPRDVQSPPQTGLEPTTLGLTAPRRQRFPPGPLIADRCHPRIHEAGND